MQWRQWIQPRTLVKKNGSKLQDLSIYIFKPSGPGSKLFIGHRIFLALRRCRNIVKMCSKSIKLESAGFRDFKEVRVLLIHTGFCSGIIRQTLLSLEYSELVSTSTQKLLQKIRICLIKSLSKMHFPFLKMLSSILCH